MEHLENLIEFINELNESGRIQYDDYSLLFDLASELVEAKDALGAAKVDIAALLWLNGDCEYCAHGEKEEFSGANKWHCGLGSGAECHPAWRGVIAPESKIQKESRLRLVQSPAAWSAFSGQRKHGLFRTSP